MKKSLLALAVLGAFAGVASAQSSVTMYGTVDLNGRYVKNDGSSRRYSLGQDGINSSQLGFKGTEDLGGGLKARFDLIAGVNADDGTTNSKFFNRRSVVKLSGGFGEVRLGRDYTPTFWNYTIFDAFGTNGLGDSSHVLASVQPTFVRADNSVGYFLPSGLGGIYGQAMVAAGEGVNTGKYYGGRIGFAAGPFDIAGAYAETNSTNKVKSANIGASYDMGFLKLMGYYAEVKEPSAKQTSYSISGVVPIGQGEIHVGYEYGKYTNPTSFKADQVPLGYVYNLSKRTAVYTTVSMLKNKDNAQLMVSGEAGSTSAPPTVGGKSQGAEFGIRHFF
ncbi:MAG: porin [Rhizobacter sp.]|nr:porin [Rhizobacter sp.]